MPRRKDSFSRALADAQKRLEKAQAERAYAQTKLGQLSSEIPALERTIVALRDQMEPSRLTGAGSAAATRPYVPGFDPAPKNLTPEELAKWYIERDLAGVSSIPPGGAKPPAKQLSDDELLPEPDGTPILEK